MQALQSLQPQSQQPDRGLTCGATTYKGAPPPGVILHRQLEVGQSYSDESCHNDEDDEDNEEDGVDGVHLVPPHAGKDVV